MRWPLAAAWAFALVLTAAGARAQADERVPSATATATATATAPAPAPVAIELPFASFFEQPIGPRGLVFTPTLRAADGRTVRLVGYMVRQERPVAGRFLLAPQPVSMSEHADGEADDLPPATVTVLLPAGQQDRLVAHRSGLVAVSGTLQLGRQEDGTGRVSWVRLLLPAGALAPRPSGAGEAGTEVAPPHRH